MSIYDALHDDHRAIVQLLEDLGEASQEEDRCMLLEELRLEVLVHAQAERVVLYERLGSEERASDVLRRQRRRHQEIERGIEEMLSVQVNGSTFDRRLSELDALVRAHVQAESRDLVPIARALLGGDEADKLGARFRAEKQRLQDRGFEPVC